MKKLVQQKILYFQGFSATLFLHSRTIGGKLFCAICHDGAGGDVYITVKLEPLRGEFLRGQFADVIPGYYMNKTHWNSVRTAGSLPEDILRDMLAESYRLVAAGLPKRTREALGLLAQ